MQTPTNSSTMLIEASSLCLYKSGLQIIDDVALTLNSNEIVTLIGPNGAGKTTLIRMLLGLQSPDTGTIKRKNGLTIGYMPQRFEINKALPLTVLRFLSLALKSNFKSIIPTLEEVGAAHLINKQVSTLSGGEFQRVCLARALINMPNLLILDEPVQGVDYNGEIELYKLIGTIRRQRGCGILMVSHDLHIVLGESDRVICLERHICCSGKPELVTKNKEYERLFGSETVKAYGVYKHNHDHSHDMAGNISHYDDESCGAQSAKTEVRPINHD